MSQLSKQSIRALCLNNFTASDLTGIPLSADKDWHPLIHPFQPDKVRLHGVSNGLSHASYDASIAHDLVLGRHPGFVVKEWAMGLRFSKWPTLREMPGAIRYWFAKLAELQKLLADEPPHYALAYTIEDFCLPDNVAGAVCDKSTFARVFVSAYNTFFDPGFHGNATLELVNDSDKVVTYKAGQGVCQFVFSWLDEPTESPYDGKYQHQTKAAHGPRFEADTVPEGLPSHWSIKSYPWKEGYEYEITRKDFYRSGGQVRRKDDILSDAVAMAKRIDDRQPMNPQAPTY